MVIVWALPVREGACVLMELRSLRAVNPDDCQQVELNIC